MSAWQLTYQQSLFNRDRSDKRFPWSFYLQDDGKNQLA